MLGDVWTIAHSRRQSQPSTFFPLFFCCLFRLATLALRLSVSFLGFLQPSEVYLMALFDYCSMSLRTQAWPAIELVSGKEGPRPF